MFAERWRTKTNLVLTGEPSGVTSKLGGSADREISLKSFNRMKSQSIYCILHERGLCR